MNDEQIARAFLEQVAIHGMQNHVLQVLTAIIGEARTTERARCVAIVEGYATGYHLPAMQVAARGMLAKIEEE